MAVAVDAKTATVTNVSGVATLTISNLTVGSGSNRAMEAMIWFATGTFPTGVTATWNGVSMTQVAGTQIADGGASVSGAKYAIIAPASGTNSLVFNWTGNQEAHALAQSYTGVDQTSVAVAFPHGNTNFGNSATASVAITSATGNLASAFHNQGAGSYGTVSGTTIAKDDTTGPAIGVVGNYDNGAATVTLTAAQPSTAWASLGSDILAAAGGASIPAGQNPTFALPLPLPRSPVDTQTWTWRQTGMLGKDQLPNRQQDWPNPLPPPNIDRSWAWRQLDKLGKDRLPDRQQDWPDPVAPPRVDAFWALGFDLRRSSASTPRVGIYFDRPLYPPSIDETWIWRQTGMLGQDKLPFRQQDWPNPTTPPLADIKSQGLSLWLVITPVTIPFRQYDWPIPSSFPNIDHSWSWSQTRMLGQDKIPFQQQDWPNPTAPPNIDHSWFQPFNIPLRTFVAAPLPFNQYDWPNPLAPPSIDRFWLQQPLPLVTPPPTPPPDETKPGGGGWIVHSFTRKRWRELLAEIEAERAALRKAAEKAKPAQRKIIEKALNASGILSDALEAVEIGPVAAAAAQAHQAELAAVRTARTRAQAQAQATILVAHVQAALAEIEEEEAEMLLFFH